MMGHTDDRGQLILAGAVVFSLVLIGIVVVFSTTLFTANMASSSASGGLSDSTATESDVDQTTEELLVRENEQTDWLLDQDETFEDREYGNDIDDLESGLEESIGEYRNLHADRKASSEPTIVDSQLYDSDPIQEGQRVGGDQGDISGLIGTDLFNNKNFDEFVLLVDTADEGDVEFQIEDNTGTDRTVKIEVEENQVDVHIRDEDNNLLDECEQVDPEDGDVYVDLTGGFVAGDPFDPDNDNSCDDLLPVKENLEPEYTLQAESLNLIEDFEFDFEFTVDEELDEVPDEDKEEAVIWSSTVEITYETRSVERPVRIESSGYDNS